MAFTQDTLKFLETVMQSEVALLIEEYKSLAETYPNQEIFSWYQNTLINFLGVVKTTNNTFKSKFNTEIQCFNDEMKKKSQIFPSSDGMCIICIEKNINIIYNPCNHKVCCISCNEKLMALKSVCPMCRSEIIDFAIV